MFVTLCRNVWSLFQKRNRIGTFLLIQVESLEGKLLGILLHIDIQLNNQDFSVEEKRKVQNLLLQIETFQKTKGGSDVLPT